jgi:type IV pilus assembly protein PilE
MANNGTAAGRSERGFTLIELMAVVAIIAILLVIAFPAYQNSVRKTHRSAAQGQMLDIANREQQFLLANRVYTATFSDFGYTVPADVALRYTCTATVDNTGVPSFTISCAPTSKQSSSNFGTLTLTSTGVKSPAGEW